MKERERGEGMKRCDDESGRGHGGRWRRRCGVS